MEPVLFCCHGGGPLPLMGQQPEYLEHFRGLASFLPAPPLAILVVSAHWEEDSVTVMEGEATSLLFDYYGFPEETYTYEYPARGSPAVAKRVHDLLEHAGLPCKKTSSRGLDHGAFVPLMAAFPDASVPVLQLSLVKGLDPALHTRIGTLLRPLRHEGVLIFGSGLSFHNMQAFMQTMRGSCSPDIAARAIEFDARLTDVCTNTAHCECRTQGGDAAARTESSALCARQRMLIEWNQFPHARFCHPREEHLAPLWVCVGAAGTDEGRKIFDGGGSALASGLGRAIAVSSFKFG